MLRSFAGRMTKRYFKVLLAEGAMVSVIVGETGGLPDERGSTGP